MVGARDRARRAGAKPRSDHTLEMSLRLIRDLACFAVEERSKTDWALINGTDIDAFLARCPNDRPRRLIILRQFFRLARYRRLVLVDPTNGLTAPHTPASRDAS